VPNGDPLMNIATNMPLDKICTGGTIFGKHDYGK
jgi:hypothetical protein